VADAARANLLQATVRDRAIFSAAQAPSAPLLRSTAMSPTIERLKFIRRALEPAYKPLLALESPLQDIAQGA
jgi:hypothetical protein